MAKHEWSDTADQIKMTETEKYILWDEVIFIKVMTKNIMIGDPQLDSLLFEIDM